MATTVDEKIVKGAALKVALGAVKTKVEGMIEESKPVVATTAKAGLVKPGQGLSVGVDGTLTVTGDAAVDPNALPAASKTAKGAVIIGDGIDVAADGTISVDQSGTLAEAKEYADQTAAEKVAALVGSAPETLDTLEEIAAKIKEGDDVHTSMLTTIGQKANSADVYTKTDADKAFAKSADVYTKTVADSTFVKSASLTYMTEAEATAMVNEIFGA